MKRLTILILIAVFVLAGFAVAQDPKIIKNEYGEKKIYLPFRKPPPSMYYVPNEMVLKLKDNVETTIVATAREITCTGVPGLDELNKKFGVKKFVRQFPDIPARIREAEREIKTKEIDMSRYYVLDFDAKHKLEEVMKAYANEASVEKVEPIGIHPVYEKIPNDQYFLTDQWNLYEPNDHDVDATDAWDYETGDITVILGDLDTGLQYNMADLGGSSPYTQGNVWINWAEYNGAAGIDDDGNGYVDDWVGWDFVNNVYNVWPGEDSTKPDNEPTDFNGHGTHVGGIMGAITNNNRGIAGLAGGWNTGPNDPANGVKIMACRIGWSAPHPIYGYEVGYVRMDFAAEAIYYAVNNGVDAINCSWGSSYTGNLAAALDYAAANDVVVVAAAGNSGNQHADYLGTRPEVIDVCATDSFDVKASWSNYGTWVDLSAPGVDILSTYSFHYAHYYAWVSGTSQAAPHVTAAAGLLRSHNPDLSSQGIFDILVNTTDDIDHLNPSYAGLMGSGRLNVFRAVDASYAPSVTVTYPNGGEVFYIGQIATVTWDASDNVGIVSTDVDYSVDGGDTWMPIASLPGNPGEYDWTVTGPPSSTCRMKVTCYDAAGTAGDDISDEDFCPPYKRLTSQQSFAIAGEGALPTEFALYQNHPNPFNPTTKIEFSLPQPSEVKLEIFNITGQKVAMLINGPYEAGTHSITWDGRDSHGQSVASGIYFYHLQAEQFSATRKMVMLK